MSASTPDQTVSGWSGRDAYGKPIDLDSIWPLYCASKPLIAAAILALERQGELDLDAPVRDILPWRMSRYVSTLTPAEILEHRTHLPAIPGLVAVMMSDEDRWNAVFRAQGSPAPATAQYSVFSGFWLLGTILQYVTGLPLGSSVRALVTDPMGVDDLGFIDSEVEYLAIAKRITVPVYRSTLDPAVLLPATGATSTLVATRPNAAFGAYGSVRSLAAFTRHLAAEAAGAHAESVLLSERFARRLSGPFDDADFDRTLRRVSQYRCGLEVDIAAHGFGTMLTSRAFGHGSEGGGITIVIDAATGLVAVTAHAVLETSPTELRARREHVLDTLVAATVGGSSSGI